jgi:hypothetical protein
LKKVKKGSKLARSTGVVLHFLGERARRARVRASRGVGLPLGIQARVRHSPVHRRRSDDLAVRVGDEHGHGPGAASTTKRTIESACSSRMGRF